MKILVTGGAGFIGSHTSDKLIQKGHEVWILDNLYSGKKENVNKNSEFILADITEYPLSELFIKERFDYVIHLAAQLDVRKSVEDPYFDARVNIEGTLKLLDAAVKSDVKKFIFISSAGVMYGDTVEPASESTPPSPVSPYGVSKLASEHYIRAYRFNHGLNYTVLRLANVYGPRQDPHGEAGVVAIFTNQMLKKEQSKLFGYGKLERDYVYVDDVVKAIILSLESGKNDVFNISTGYATSVGKLFETMREYFSDIPEPELLPTRSGELQRSVVSYGKASNLLNWNPSVELDKGLERTIDYFKTRTL